MNFKNDFLARVANQAATSATPSAIAVEQTAPAIIETAPAATEVVEVVEEVPAVEPQPEVQPVKAEVPAKAAPQQQQEPVRSHKAPEKGKKVLKDLKELPTNLSLTFMAWVVDIEFADLGQGQVKVTSMKAASSEAGRINIVATPDIEQELYNIMILEGKSPLVNVKKYNDHYVVSELVTSVEKASQTKVLTFGSEAQIPQWIINGLQKNGIAITPENIKAALDTIIVGTNDKGMTVVISKKEVTNAINAAKVITGATVTATNAIATTTNASTVPAAAATNVATATTGSATNVPATRK